METNEIRAQLNGGVDRSDGRDFTLTFARFDVQNQIFDSRFRDHRRNYMERVHRGAFRQTFEERAGKMRFFFNHGFDPAVGMQSLGEVLDVREGAEGAEGDVRFFEGPPFDGIRQGLAGGQYGVSYRFGPREGGEEWVMSPGRSSANPEGLPERELRGLHVVEFGPTPIPADEGTQDLVQVRSMSHLLEIRQDQETLVDPDGAGASVDEQPINDDQIRDQVRLAMAMRRRRYVG